MTLETFISLCMHRGITLDEGYALYTMYRTGFVGLPKNLSETSLLKLKEKKLYSNGHVGEELKEEFRIVEMEFGDGSKYTETLEMNDRTVRITQPVVRKELACIPILDSVMEGLYNILVTDKIKSGSLHKSLLARTTLYFNQDIELAKYYLIWYYLWPTACDKNDSWENLFMVSYNNVSLRNSTEGKLREFKDIARKKDIRIYVLSTYVFIKSGIKDNRAFIQKYDNFKGVKDEWYLFTIDLIDELKENLTNLFDRDFMVSSRKQKFVNSSAGILV